MKPYKRKNSTTKHTHKRSGVSKSVNSVKTTFTMRFNNINEPKSVEDFRKNLLEYYFSQGNKIYTQEIDFVDVTNLNCIQDLIELVKSEGYNTLNLTPKVVELENWSGYVKRNMKTYSMGLGSKLKFLEDFWKNNDSHIIITDDMEFMKTGSKIMGNIFWKDILNPNDLYTIYHSKVMGEFGLYPDWDITKELVFSTF